MRPEREAFAAVAWQPVAMGEESADPGSAGALRERLRMRGFVRQRREDLCAWQDAWDALHDADCGRDDGQGRIIWRDLEGRPHRRVGPSVIDHGRRLAFHHHGLLHRPDAPAIIEASGARHYAIEGVRHRLDGPAIIHANGSQEWWVDGERHNALGPAVIHADGTREYWLRGVLVDGEDEPIGGTDLLHTLFGA